MHWKKYPLVYSFIWLISCQAYRTSTSPKRTYNVYMNIGNDELHPEKVIDVTKQFVCGIISKSGAGICPYSVDADIAGIPLGKVRYSISFAKSFEDAEKDYWKEVEILSANEISEVSTTLLIYPYTDSFADFGSFDEFCRTIDSAADNLNTEKVIDNVFFHPCFKFVDRDEQNVALFDDNGDFLGFSGDIVTPVSYARRSPWPIVNILRSPMVAAAQKYVPEGRVIARNTEKMGTIGNDALQRMLDTHNWEELITRKDDKRQSSEPMIERRNEEEKWLADISIAQDNIADISAVNEDDLESLKSQVISFEPEQDLEDEWLDKLSEFEFDDLSMPQNILNVSRVNYHSPELQKGGVENSKFVMTDDQDSAETPNEVILGLESLIEENNFSQIEIDELIREADEWLSQQQ